jgi:hypothetical protein
MRGSKKHGRSSFGYKNHVNAHAKHKLIRTLCGDRRGRARQPGAGRAVGHGQHLQ